MASFYLFSFIFGLIIGSFLNTVIYRYNTGWTLGGRSRCLTCARALGWRELVPVLSFVCQGGKCLKCQSRVSWQYPLVELLTGGLFALTLGKFFPLTSWVSILLLVSAWLSVSLLVVIAVYDWRHKIIPDGPVYSFIILTLALALWQAPEHLLAGLYFFAFFALLWLVSRGRWIGFGDAKLVLGIGFMLGLWPGLSALFLAFWSGAIVGLAIILINRLCLKGKSFTIKSELPFAPFLILGLLLVFFFELNVIGI